MKTETLEQALKLTRDIRDAHRAVERLGDERKLITSSLIQRHYLDKIVELEGLEFTPERQEEIERLRWLLLEGRKSHRQAQPVGVQPLPKFTGADYEARALVEERENIAGLNNLTTGFPAGTQFQVVVPDVFRPAPAKPGLGFWARLWARITKPFRRQPPPPSRFRAPEGFAETAVVANMAKALLTGKTEDPYLQRQIDDAARAAELSGDGYEILPGPGKIND